MYSGIFGLLRKAQAHRPPPSPIFGPFLLWPNGCMHQNALAIEVGLGPGDCVRWGPRSPLPKGGGQSPQIFGPCLLWSYGWMDEAGTWHGGRPQPRQLCVRWGPSTPPPERGRSPPQFSAHFYCGQTAGCVKMPLDMDVGLSPGDFVLDGEAVPLPDKGAEPPNFWPMFIMAKRLDGSRCHLVRR